MIRALERILFLVAAVSLGWYATAKIDAAHEQAALSEELARAQAHFAVYHDDLQARGSHSAGTNSHSAGTKLTTAKRKSSATSTSTSSSSTPARTTVGDLVGRIEVPRLGLAVGAREGIDTRTLRVAAGHVPGTALPGGRGNAAFAAHRDTFFRPLKDVREGDEITVATPSANYRYVVTGTSIVEPDDVSVLEPTTEAVLTLITCYPFNYIGNAPQRYIVRARIANR